MPEHHRSSRKGRVQGFAARPDSLLCMIRTQDRSGAIMTGVNHAIIWRVRLGDAHCSSFVHFDARHTPSSPHAGRTNFDLLTGFAPACYTLQSTCHQLFVQVLEGEFRTRPVIASVIDSAKLVRHGGLRLLQMNRGRLISYSASPSFRTLIDEVPLPVT